ncbi:uncharacterized protein LOC119954397 isoform X2 [Scyliorhinus canicula]|uniref:uncharacterized protein LOC119954397 isoform X2 n=1 Tax=Scyliorhinus canicula TaxID=7830 RepID=UPI0018F616D7|nr:uncharacterized protein LOC119954397 isoform X2 [Scyliorhinus canicula]
MPENHFLITILFLCLAVDSEAAETINCNPIWRRVGDNVTIPCSYRPKSDQNGYLDIEWAIRNINESDQMILTQAGGKVYVTPGWQQRISFASENGSKGDASLYFNSLDVNDSGIYNCKVKIDGKIEQKTCNLTVQVQDIQSTSTITPTTAVTQHNETGSSPQLLHFIVPGILGFSILLTLSAKYLQYKIRSSRAPVNTMRQSEDFIPQDYLQCNTAQSPNENIIYSSVWTARQDTVNSTAQAQDQDIIYSKVQKHRAIQNYNEIIPCTPKQNSKASPLSDRVINYDQDIVYAKLKNPNMASV